MLVEDIEDFAQLLSAERTYASGAENNCWGLSHFEAIGSIEYFVLFGELNELEMDGGGTILIC